MERFTAAAAAACNGNPHQRPTSHTHPAVSFSPMPRPSHPLRPPAVAKDLRLRRLPEEMELSVFDAERYFNPRYDPPEPRHRHNKGRALPDGTRSPSSVAGWSGQYGPLPPAGVAPPLSKQGRMPSSTCRWSFGGTCPCSGKKAVDVEEKYPVPRSPNHPNPHGAGSGGLNEEEEELETGEVTAPMEMEDELGLDMEEMVELELVAESWLRGPGLFSAHHFSPEKYLPEEVLPRGVVQFALPVTGRGGFSFPVLRQTVAAAVKGPPRTETPPDDPSRDSLEVFQPAEFQRRAVAMRSPFPGEGGPRRSPAVSAGSPTARVAAVEDDLASDSSSDLFEIESFSAQVTPSRAPRGSTLEKVSAGGERGQKHRVKHQHGGIKARLVGGRAGHGVLAGGEREHSSAAAGAALPCQGFSRLHRPCT